MIDVALMDRLTQEVKFTSGTGGTITTFDGTTVLHTADFNNALPGRLPSEISMLMDNIRVMLSGGSPGVVGTFNPLTGGITKISKLTQAQYDAIVTKDDSTLYVIVV